MIWSTVPEIQNILKLVILGHFLPFYHPKKPQNQNFQKWKNLLEISSFYTNSKNLVPETPYRVRQISFFVKSKFKNKNEKNTWRYHHFTYVYQKLWSDYLQFLRYGAWQTDGRMVKVTYTALKTVLAIKECKIFTCIYAFHDSFILQLLIWLKITHIHFLTHESKR